MDSVFFSRVVLAVDVGVWVSNRCFRKMGSRQRRLNSFESFFAESNVRFAVLLEFTNDRPLCKDIEQSCRNALQSCRLGHLTLEQEPKENSTGDGGGGAGWVMKLDRDASMRDPKITRLESIPDDMGKYLEERVVTDTLMAVGPLVVEVLTTTSSHQEDCRCVGISINGNHALVDGQSMKHFLGAIANDHHPCQEKRTGPWTMLPDWQELVAASQTQAWDEEPKYLPASFPMLQLKDIMTNNIENKEGQEDHDDVRCTISAKTLSTIKEMTKTKGSTISGFLVTLLMASLAAEYIDQGHRQERDVGISVLVDLRSYLNTAHKEINQAIGTVTVSLPAIETFSGWSQNNQQWFVVANQVTSQLRARVERGEAHRCAVALCSGHFEAASPEATMELSNLGVCRFSSSLASRLHVSQRFDGYDGASCMIHTESASGVLRWTTSYGNNQCKKTIQRIMGRVQAWIERC